MAASFSVGSNCWLSSNQPVPVFLTRCSLTHSFCLRLDSSGYRRAVGICVSAVGSRKVDDEIHKERQSGAFVDGQRNPPLEIKEPEGRNLAKKGGSNEGFEWKWPPWKDLQLRYKLIGTTSLAFVICNMDKVNLSVAIIPMSHQYGWNASTAGLVQSSFFWGYALSQLPGGWLSKLLGGRKVLEVGVMSWSLATMLVPLVAGFFAGIVISRILVGVGEGVSPSCGY
ncbi:hypothetical protein HPP92_021678 [Vanilla planifolia]|uniref:Major facilitator superfamily (MFS) profile domain-containing protein n=1 Tax=Vanilla planifolia TaxID=51239 RepID=A0A835PZZ5_VANPL|nr:hypothetical protein HPP92_021997 [Vanilla planifolia]KAG0463202.1 hypothetical protein HPP92_021678 [Vanilla planifolia]